MYSILSKKKLVNKLSKTSYRLKLQSILIKKQQRNNNDYNKPVLQRVNKINDTSLFFITYRPSFWTDSYSFLTNSSLSHSIDFNINIQKYLNLVNNIEKISNNDKFYFSDIFEKFEYTSNYKTKKSNVKTLSLLNNKSTATKDYKFKYKLLGELKHKFAFTLYNRLNNCSLSNQRSLNLLLR